MVSVGGTAVVFSLAPILTIAMAVGALLAFTNRYRRLGTSGLDLLGCSVRRSSSDCMNESRTFKAGPIILALVVALCGCTSTDARSSDPLDVALTTSVPELGGATIEEAVYAHAERVCPGIRPPFIVFNTGAREPGFSIEVQVGLKARSRFCEVAPDCFFTPTTVAVVPADAPSAPRVDVRALATEDDPCWGD